MKKQILLCLSLILGITTFSFAQTTRTITNDDLEKFRQQRERADAEYRATYKQRGLPSPEEIAAQETARQKDLAEYAARARELQQRQDEIQSQSNSGYVTQYVIGQDGYSTQQPYYTGGQVLYDGYSSGGGYYGGRYRGNRRNYYTNVQPHTQLSPLLPNVQINRTPIRIFSTPTNPPARIYSSPARGGGRIR